LDCSILGGLTHVCGGVDKSFFAVDFPDHLSDLSVFVGHGYDSRRRFGESSGGKSRFRFARMQNVWSLQREEDCCLSGRQWGPQTNRDSLVLHNKTCNRFVGPDDLYVAP
jgi:hypothetical protein